MVVVKKIGVLTFHWAANYGAVLQAYALLKYLNDNGYDAEDVDYRPLRVMAKLKFFELYLRKIENIKRSLKINTFPKKFLKLSKHKYYNYSELHRTNGKYDVLICGSDQIWNESFLMTAEKNPVPSYYLGFADDKTERISYAASFGTNALSENLKKYGVAELKKYSAVSVREENAVELLKNEGVDAVAVCDPTLLVEPEDYYAITDSCKKCDKVDVFNFMLRKGRESTDKTDMYVRNKYSDKKLFNNRIVTVEQWLYSIKNSDFVVTDSFHCTVFSILFHKPFLAINDINCPMNARIRTLTQKLGLEDRVLEAYDEEKIESIISQSSIDWESVDKRRRDWANNSAVFLKDSL